MNRFASRALAVVAAGCGASSAACGILVGVDWDRVAVDAGSFADSQAGPASGAEGGAADCTLLAPCCASLSGQLQATCAEFVDAGSPSCGSVLQSYHASGYCTGGSGCANLAQCCPDLPPSSDAGKAACNSYVQQNNDTTCTDLLSNYQRLGYCNGHPGGLSDNCYALSLCCPDVPLSEQGKCTGDVSQNVDPVCKTAVAAYKADGSCP